MNPTPAPSIGLNRSFIEIWLIALFRPRLESYQGLLQERHKSLNRTLNWIYLAAVLALIIRGFGIVIYASLEQSLQQANTATRGLETEANTGGGGYVLMCASPILALFLLLIWVILIFSWHFIAKFIMKSQAKYEDLAFLVSASQAPLLIVATVASLIPLVNLCAYPFFLSYQSFIAVIAIKAVYNIGWGEALATHLIAIFGLTFIWFPLCALSIFITS
jgi:hypothetical protein